MQIAVIGLDLAKNVFQVHGIDDSGQAAVKRKLRRSEVLPFFAELDAALVGIKACDTAHYWGREIAALGHDVRLMPPQFVKPYVKGQKNDAADAALRQAQAQVLQAEAQVVQAEPVSQQIGQADTQVGQLKGQVEQAQAKLDQALLNLSWMVVTAPQDGWITKRNVEVGDYVTVGQQIFSIVTPDVWITANFKESQLDRMRPGQPATIKLDAYPHLDL
jgi:multidrug resistance efflux pump